MKETKKKKRQAWDYALGMIRIDGLTPSPEFMELVKKEIDGEITTEEISRVLRTRYQTTPTKSKIHGKTS